MLSPVIGLSRLDGGLDFHFLTGTIRSHSMSKAPFRTFRVVLYNTLARLKQLL